MYCRNCGEAMKDEQAICLKCGVEKNKGNSYCSSCGKSVAPNAAVCLNCGVAIKNEKDSATGSLGGQDKTTMILVCLFLGGFGVHNFMMGEKKKGIMKIVFTCLCGIGGILALIDLIKILTDKYVVEIG